jgi:hypothetical protein
VTSVLEGVSFTMARLVTVESEWQRTTNSSRQSMVCAMAWLLIPLKRNPSSTSLLGVQLSQSVPPPVTFDVNSVATIIQLTERPQ